MQGPRKNRELICARSFLSRVGCCFSPPFFYLTVHRINWFPLSVSVWILGPSTRKEQSSQYKRVYREQSANPEALPPVCPSSTPVGFGSTTASPRPLKNPLSMKRLKPLACSRVTVGGIESSSRC